MGSAGRAAVRANGTSSIARRAVCWALPLGQGDAIQYQLALSRIDKHLHKSFQGEGCEKATARERLPSQAGLSQMAMAGGEHGEASRALRVLIALFHQSDCLAEPFRKEVREGQKQ
jgi:hypothetical protein